MFDERSNVHCNICIYVELIWVASCKRNMDMLMSEQVFNDRKWTRWHPNLKSLSMLRRSKVEQLQSQPKYKFKHAMCAVGREDLGLLCKRLWQGFFYEWNDMQLTKPKLFLDSKSGVWGWGLAFVLKVCCFHFLPKWHYGWPDCALLPCSQTRSKSSNLSHRRKPGQATDPWS